MATIRQIVMGVSDMDRAYRLLERGPALRTARRVLWPGVECARPAGRRSRRAPRADPLPVDLVRAVGMTRP